MRKKILELIIDNKLNFRNHINELYIEVSQTVGVLCRLSSYPRMFYLTGSRTSKYFVIQTLLLVAVFRF